MQQRPLTLILSYITARIITLLFGIPEGYIYAILVTIIIFILPRIFTKIPYLKHFFPVSDSQGEIITENNASPIPSTSEPESNSSPPQESKLLTSSFQSLKIKWLKHQKQVIPKKLMSNQFGKPLLSSPYDFNQNFTDPFIIIDNGESTFLIVPEKTKSNLVSCFQIEHDTSSIRLTTQMKNSLVEEA